MSRWFDSYGFGDVGDQLLIGAYPQDADDVAALVDAGVTCVFNLVQDIEYEGDGREACAMALRQAGILEKRVQVVDYGNLLPGHIERAVQIVRPWLADGERVYVHCRAGMQRSATVAAAIVALEEGVSPTEALRRVSERNPRANPLEHQRQDLFRWWTARSA